MKDNTPLTQQQRNDLSPSRAEEIIKRLIESNVDIQEISNTFGFKDRGSIYRYLRRKGLNVLSDQLGAYSKQRQLQGSMTRDTTLREQVVQLYRKGFSQIDISRQLKLEASSCRRIISSLLDEGVITPGERADHAMSEIVDNLKAELNVTRAENQTLAADNKNLRTQAGLEDRIIQAVSQKLKLVNDTMSPRAPKRKRYGAKDTDWVLLVSDAHAGEVVNPEEAMGFEYNWDIALKRIDDVFASTMLQAGNNPPESITVAFLGDMLSGSIHEELRETNDHRMSEATVLLANHLAQKLIDLSAVVKKIRAVVLVGNHSRLDKKPSYKNKWDNWEFVMGSIIQGIVAPHGITVEVPKQLVHIETLGCGQRLAMMHGDGIKTANFAGIPFYGMAKRREAVQGLMRSIGLEHVNALIMGHFHQHLYWNSDTDIIINGSIKGGDEYIIGSRLASTHPRQLLLFYSKRGLMGQRHIDLA